jgi:hypothetical protein
MSTVKVNTVDKRTGGTLTLGGCGTTVTLGAGATQSGFGRTGTVDWCTTAKTAPFTGVSGNGYFVNTTSGVVTVTLPATPSAGDIISIADYASTFNTNNLTICNNSSKINGVCSTASLSTQGQSITLVYVDATRGWKNTMDSTSNVTAAPTYIVATGGTISCCGDYKIHTFTSDGTFTICTAPTPANNNVSYMVVAGGASGGLGDVASGGGGAGGYREGKVSTDPYTASPLDSTAGLPVSVQAYPITVGAGGASLTSPPALPASSGNSGSNSTFSTITSAGGGGGGAQNGAACGSNTAQAGGSGGGAMGNSGPTSTGGAGNTPPVSPAQGFRGGNAANPPSYQNTGGGGGATAQGQDKTSSYGPTGGAGGNGGAGATTSITGSPVSYAGGGGGSADTRAGNSGAPSGTGGTGGGGAGANFTCAAGSGTTNTGGGGGAGNGPSNGANPVDSGAGGSGIVIIRYKFQ